MLQLDNYELLTPIYLLLTFLAFLFFQCSFVPRFSIHIETVYENNNGSSENVSKRFILLYIYNLLINMFSCVSEILKLMTKGVFSFFLSLSSQIQKRQKFTTQILQTLLMMNILKNIMSKKRYLRKFLKGLTQEKMKNQLKTFDFVLLTRILRRRVPIVS